jgi:radical SAM superfamily enzyme YgiQ (UPF0313 family)
MRYSTLPWCNVNCNPSAGVSAVTVDLVLLNPPTTASDRYGALSAGGSKLPPLGIAGLAAVAREAGFSVAIVDAECLDLGAREAADAVLELKPAVLGVTSVTMTVNAAAEVARLVKAEAPHTFAIAGGAHATALPEATLGAFPWLDAVAIGEAEVTIKELLAALPNTRELDGIAGLLFRRDGAMVRTEPRIPVEDLDSLPLPAWDLLPDLATRYRPPLNGVSRLPASSFVSSRGCSGRCTFCDRAVSGHRMRFHSAAYVMRAVEVLYHRYGIRDLHFHDDNLLANRTRLLDLCERLESAGLDLRWSAEGRVDMVTQDVLAAMKRAGCWQIAYGIESGSQRQLDTLCKGITIEQASKATALTHAAGIESRGLFMIGTPGENRESLEATTRFLLSLPLDDMVVQTFEPHPGTEIAKSLGLRQDDPDEWRHSSRWEIAFVPEGLTARDLLRAQRKAFRDFYFRPRVIARYLRRLLSSATLARELLRGFAGWVVFVLSRSRPNGA